MSNISIETAKELSIKSVESMSIAEKEEYFRVLRDYCKTLGVKYKQNITFLQEI